MKSICSIRRPRIGITIGTGTPRRLAAIDYRKSVWEAGGTPVLIGRTNADKAMECDGLIFSGGWDIDPSLYPRRPEDADLLDSQLIHRYFIRPELKRDRFELPLARRVLQETIPVLGICRGLQVLNVAAGGRLIPHVPRWSETVTHRFGRGEKSPLHPIEAAATSRLAAITNSGSLIVNSYHHQGLSDAELAPAFIASGRSADGLIESFEKADHRFFLAVQWHPERFRDAKVHERFRPLFDELISTARNGC